ncbi:hypothetical protein Zmor_007551 [Zophobas morio]|uniref:Sodium-coupled monocarboxylate transporter 1 n=1 Tax=Zophobas morio TaxID=2755281 RepID=A0AA38MPK1_9CUCU|nr:hypothetical protein Zmor_007551 [Zophobas morio]
MNISTQFVEDTVQPFTLKSTINNLSFSWFDAFIVFVTIFVFNVCMGVYFNYFTRKQSTTSEYLLGGRTMNVIPVVISLVASHTSANTLLSVPADVYRYGAAYLLGAISTIILTVVTIYVYLPVFFNLGITSVYEYLERRFDSRTRLLASFLSIVSYILYLPIVIYVPSLAFSAATGVNVHFMAASICGLCIFYSAIGGLRAVIWTDAVQFMIAILAVSLICMMGLQSTGGFSVVWRKAIDSKRLDIFDFDMDPTKRDTFWSLAVGLTTQRVATVAISQNCMQKFLAVPTFRQSVLTVIYFGVGTIIIKTITIFLGLLIYAEYSACDPLSAQKITTDNQLVTYFVMDVSKNIPGLPGLFIAGVFSASLSTLSGDLNCLAGIIYEDFIVKLSNEKISDKRATTILQLLVIICGLICTLMVYIVEHMGGLFSLGYSLSGVTTGAILGMFTMGIFYPGFNAKGAFYGGLCGFITIACIIFPAQYYQMMGLLNYVSKPTSTKYCNVLNDTFPVTTTPRILSPSTELSFIFRISFYYYCLMATVITLFFGLVISTATRRNNDQFVDRKLISPLGYTLLQSEVKDCSKNSMTKQC